VSKYIGETEKNLRSIFDAARDRNAILFFDEADALFGKRTEVKDAQDRYASLEIGYFLGRAETCGGLVILSAVTSKGLSKALLQRVKTVVEFPRRAVRRISGEG
jgi:SpoVK/Ycf46/Vps4 family AAA+-type ATPase